MNITNITHSIFDPFGPDYDPLISTLSDELVFVDLVDELFSNSLIDALSFSDSFIIEGDFSNPLTDLLSFTDSFIVEATFDRDLSDSLVFSDEYLIYGYEITTQSLSFTDFFVHYNILGRTLSDTLIFVDSFVKVDLIDILVFTDSFSYLLTHTAFTDVLFFEDRFIVDSSPTNDLFDHLFFIDNFSFNGNYTLTLHDQLFFPEPYIPNYQNRGINIPSWVVFKTQKDKHNNYLFLQSPHGSIILDSPLFGDLESNISDMKINRTVGGARYTYVKKSNRKHLKYEFNMREGKYYRLLTFLDDSNLDWITLTNWKEETWLVKIVNNPVTLKASARDTFSVVLELEGYRVIAGDYRCLE